MVDLTKMMSIRKSNPFRGLREKLRSNPENNHVTTPSVFLGQKPPPILFDPQMSVAAQSANYASTGTSSTAFDAQQSIAAQSASYPSTGTSVNRYPSNGTSSTNPQSSHTAPYSPQDIGGHPTGNEYIGGQRFELDSNRYQTKDEMQQNLYWEEWRRQEHVKQEVLRQRGQEHQAEMQRQMHERDRVRQATIRKREEEKRAEAERKRVEMEQEASKAEVRQVRELIRERYRLDLYIWKNRDVQVADRDIITEYCERSDKIMKQLQDIVGAWESERFEKDEWEVARAIKESLVHYTRCAIWQEQAPWDRDD